MSKKIDAAFTKFHTADEAVHHIVREHAHGRRGPFLMDIDNGYMDFVLQDLSLTEYDWNRTRAFLKPQVVGGNRIVIMKTFMSMMPRGLLNWYGTHKLNSQLPMRLYIHEVGDVWPELQRACKVPEILRRGEEHQRPKGSTHFIRLSLTPEPNYRKNKRLVV